MTETAAVILAAGLSRRMGTPKMLLPWKKTTVLGQVVSQFYQSGINNIVVVTGGARPEVEAEVSRLSKDFPVNFVHNPSFETGEMLSSLQVGLQYLDQNVSSALVGLGDQPQLSLSALTLIISISQSTRLPLLIPSYQMHRGHPLWIHRDLWAGILSLKSPETIRDFIILHAQEIEYVFTDSTILKDLDTPEEYQREKP